MTSSAPTRTLSFLAALHGMRGDAAREAIDRVLRRCSCKTDPETSSGAFLAAWKRRLASPPPCCTTRTWCCWTNPPPASTPVACPALRGIEDLRDQGKTVIYTTHYMEEAERLCDRIAIMDKDPAAGHGAPEAVAAPPWRRQRAQLEQPDTGAQAAHPGEPQAMLRQWLAAEPGAAEAHIGVRPRHRKTSSST